MPRTVENGERAVGVLVHPYGCLDVMASVAIGRDLQNPPLIADGIVVADDPFLLDAEDVGEGAAERYERRAGLFRRPGEAALCSGR